MQDLTPFMNKYILICIIALLSLTYPPFLHAKSAVFGTQKLTLPPSKVTLDEETLQKVEIEKEKIGKVWEIFMEGRLWEGNFIQPVAGEMSDNFGLRRIINGG